ncbi:MAG: hypothetical protein A2Y12_20670 [Planctomycetes bacterium GWF2_42_9]|nr:MAG: hypothetical protein A2Y12_20670 [Planctomycetes bacterium GWF2_42_9]
MLKIEQGKWIFAQAGQKTGVKSGVFQCFSRLFHRKIGKIPVFSGFFMIFGEGVCAYFKKAFVSGK